MADLLSLGIHGLTLLLLVALLVIYLANYRRLRSKYTAGLVFFIGFMIAETAMSISFAVSMVMYTSLAAEAAALTLQAVKAVGLAILLWISWE
ncbi:MAG: hypothetical protein HY369_05435 [Candidatus Aenigmarchaeota archaeon]|nr:hypothetical protein [Candidatus Aenigmarchaeota archaeon]